MATSLFTELECTAPDAARRLLGCELARLLPNGALLRVKIVEVEAYDESDPASHSYKGKTMRTSAMYSKAGHAYVYFIYGKYHCLNVSTGPDGHGEAVLIRAVEPIEGEASMAFFRNGKIGVNLTNGPSKLCAAMDIDRLLDNHDLSQPPLTLTLAPPLDPMSITQTTRIGITRGNDTPWRFYITDSLYVSKK